MIAGHPPRPAPSRAPADRPAFTERLAAWLEVHATLILLLFGVVSVALVYPLWRMKPEATASQEPQGPLFEARRLAVERFASRAHRMVFVVEARDGDLLRAAPLGELLENIRALRRDPDLGPRLLRFPSARSGAPVHGVTSLAELVDGQLRRGGAPGLAAATGARVQQIIGRILTVLPPADLALSTETRRDPGSGTWRCPAMTLLVLGDNEQLGGGGQSATLGTRSTHKERFARQVLARLRGQQRHLRVWGLAIDVNLTSMEQGRAAGPFIGFTILAVLLLVGLLLRSYWAVATVGLAMGALMLWLQGLSNLVGLKQDQIFATIVPIAMISFGVDFTFHGIGRYRESCQPGRSPALSFRLGLAGALGALLLAVSTDSAAFLSNLCSSIESLQQFGIAAALGTVSSFLLLGVFAPLLLSRLEQRVGHETHGWSGLRLLLEVGGGLLAALAIMAAVVLLVFVEPLLGVALLGGYALLFIALPALLFPRPPGTEAAPTGAPEARGQVPWLGRVVSTVARYRAVVLPLALAVTGGAVILALRIEARFDVKDFFSPRSDFVVGLGKFDRHAGKRSGEPALINVEGPLARPEAVRALREFCDRLRRLQTDTLARNADGSLRLRAGLVEVLAAVGPASRSAVEAATGIRLADSDGDGIFDAAAQQLAVYRHARGKGLPAEGGKQALTADDVRTHVWVSADGERIATALGLRIPGSRSMSNLAEARGAVEPLVKTLDARLKRIASSASAVFTGQPVARHAALEAILDAFRVSLVVAVLLCLLLASLFMRSLRYALVSIVPILLVVAWLYAFMYLAGYSVNVVTATIGAISIGVGIDFAVHFTMRFREELALCTCRRLALYQAGAGTGGALLGAGVSSILGFSILALAPMPMFAAFGLLTAVMISMASVATLLVLPSLLILVTPAGRHPRPGQADDCLCLGQRRASDLLRRPPEGRGAVSRGRSET